jgi:hypothetical protein
MEGQDRGLLRLPRSERDDAAAGLHRKLLGLYRRAVRRRAVHRRHPADRNALVGRLVPRAERGTVYGITASAMFLGNSMGPLTGGAVAAAFGLRWVFLVTAVVLLTNLLWVYYRVPEYVDRES